MPRVLIAHPSADVYGSDRQLIESIAALSDAGWTVTLALPGPGPMLDLLEDTTVVFTPVPVVRKSALRPAALARSALAFPHQLLRLVRLIRRERPAIVYVNTVTIPIWTLAARLARTPVLVHVHEAEQLLPAAARALLYAPLRGATAVIANSATTRDVVVDSCPRLGRRLSVIANGVPDPGRQPRGAVRPGRVVLVGRLSPRKGVDVALEAITLLRSAGRPVSLQICGTAYEGYEWFEAALRRQAAQPDLAGAVEFAGYVSPTGPSLGDAEIVIAPSFGESFGNVAVEGMLAARPVVASNVQGLAEIIVHEQTGLLVPAGDATALAAAIGRLLDDPELATRLADSGRDAALRRYTAERYRHEIVDLVTTLAEAPGSPVRVPTF